MNRIVTLGLVCLLTLFTGMLPARAQTDAEISWSADRSSLAALLSFIDFELTAAAYSQQDTLAPTMLEGDLGQDYSQLAQELELTADSSRTLDELADQDLAAGTCLDQAGQPGQLTALLTPEARGDFRCLSAAPGTNPSGLAQQGVELLAQQPATHTAATQEFDQLSLPAAELFQDLAPHTLKNYNTNIYAKASEQTFTRTMAGVAVQIKITPVSYTFDYGDGSSSGPLNTPGYSVGQDWDRQTPTSHRYSQTGQYQYSVTTEYRGEYRVGQGPWRVIAGTGLVKSQPKQLTVWKAKPGQVGDSCLKNPQGVGCPQAGGQS